MSFPVYAPPMFDRVPTALPDVFLVQPRVFRDHRGFLAVTWHAAHAARLGLPERWVQENQSRSRSGVIRGLHLQVRRPQAKLVRVAAGEILDVAVDVRVGSPTFGRHVAHLLSAENALQLFIPEGFAHGFSVLSEQADVVYLMSGEYDPQDQMGVLCSDPALGIDWRVKEPVLSDQDRGWATLAGTDPARLPRFR